MQSKTKTVYMNPWQQDMERSAAEASLNYVTDSTPGIVRIRKGKGFSYLQNGKLIRSTETIQRIRKLAIPPAWENVWICSDENGHLQATGFDVKNRKQYRYHARWHDTRNENKFKSL